MDFEFSDEQEMLRTASRSLLEDALSAAPLRATIDSELGFDRDLWRTGATMGWAGIALPEGLGGAGQGVIDLVVVAEEHGRSMAPGPFISSTLAAEAILALGSSAQQEELIPPIASGDTLVSWALAESAGRWDLDTLSATVERNGDGLVLNGVKSFVQDAAAADLLVVTALVDGALGQVVVPTTAPGVRVEALQTFDITRRFYRVHLDHVRLPSTALLGDGDAREAIIGQLHLACVLLSAETVAAAEQLLDMTVQYAKDRVQFGRAIGSFQAIKHKLADLVILLEGSRVVTYDAAMALADGAADVPEAVSIAKSHTGDSCARLASEALQIHGGIGFTWEHDLHLYLRRIKSNGTLFGDPTDHREHLCRLITARGGGAT